MGKTASPFYGGCYPIGIRKNINENIFIITWNKRAYHRLYSMPVLIAGLIPEMKQQP